jgi:hypothetical protein
LGQLWAAKGLTNAADREVMRLLAYLAIRGSAGDAEEYSHFKDKVIGMNGVGDGLHHGRPPSGRVWARKLKHLDVLKLSD